MARSTGVFERAPRVLLVNAERESGAAVSEWLAEEGVKSSWVRSVKEAVDLLHDMVFIESKFDGLLVDNDLPDGSGLRVLRDYRHEFPSITAALITAEDDISIGLWSKSRQIPLLRKPLERKPLIHWLEQFKISHAQSVLPVS